MVPADKRHMTKATSLLYYRKKKNDFVLVLVRFVVVVAVLCFGLGFCFFFFATKY